MAKGSPDYFSLSVVPQKGPLIQSYTPDVLCKLNTYVTVINISGKGEVFGGNIELAGLTTATVITAYLNIDAKGRVKSNIYDSYAKAVLPKKTAPIYAISYDLNAVAIMLGVSPDITFSESFVVEIYATGVLSPLANSYLYYSSIE